MRPPPGPVYSFVMSAILLFPWSLALYKLVGFLLHKRKNKKLREETRDKKGGQVE